jgi:hypothetical protein
MLDQNNGAGLNLIDAQSIHHSELKTSPKGLPLGADNLRLLRFAFPLTVTLRL